MNRIRSIAILMLAALIAALVSGCAGNTGGGQTTEPALDGAPPVTFKNAAEALFDAGTGTLRADSTGTLTVGFLGGAVSEGQVRYNVNGKVSCTSLWVDSLLWYFKERFPAREVRACDAAIAGAASGYGVAFFRENVLRYAPDIVFLELSAGEAGEDRDTIRTALESLILQARAAEKVPVLCLLLSAPPVGEDDAAYGAWRAAADAEREIADRYGVLTIDFYDAMKAEYTADGREDFALWCSERFIGDDPVPASLEGHAFYSDTVIAAIERDPVAFYAPIGDAAALYAENEDVLSYTLIAPGDARLSYTGEWTVYDAYHRFQPEQGSMDSLMKIEDGDYAYPHFSDGIRESRTEGDSVTLETSAPALYVLMHTTRRGGTATVLLDGDFYATLNSNSIERENGLTDPALYPPVVKNVIDSSESGLARIDLPGDGASHTVSIVTDAIAGSHAAFRFGCILEGTTAPISFPSAEPPVQSEPEGKRYAADGLLDASGRFGGEGTGELRAAFIGGSLTEGQTYYDVRGTLYAGNVWTNLFCKYLGEAFPNKTIRAYNSGIGGTPSDFGAVRFASTVLDFAPDIIFIEFAVNDFGASRAFSQSYMEMMLRQAKTMEKEPVVVFLYAPCPVERDTEEYAQWLRGVEYKQELADYYGIGSVNVYEWLYGRYTASGKATLDEFLADYYHGDPGNYDVHGGYDLYFEAIRNSLETDPSALIRRIGEVEGGFEGGTYDGITDSAYTYIPLTDERVTLAGEWTLYTQKNQYDDRMLKENRIPGYAYDYPRCDRGVLQSSGGGDAVMLTTSARALCFYYITSNLGNGANVYVDGALIVEASVMSDFSGMTCLKRIALPDDGKEHEVRLVTQEPQGENLYFRIGYLVEESGGS